MFHLRFGLSDHLKALLDFVFGSRRRVKKVRIFRAWFSHGSGAVPALETFGRKPFSSLRSEKFVLRRFFFFCAGDGFVFGVGCWFLLLVGVFLLWCFVSCCVSFLASAPYAPSYISYDVSSHSEWALDFLLGCSTTGVAFLIPF